MSKFKSCLPLAIVAAASVFLAPQSAQAVPTLNVGSTAIPLTNAGGGTFTFSGSQNVSIGDSTTARVTSATITANTTTSSRGSSIVFKLGNFTLQAGATGITNGTITFSNLFSGVNLTGPITIAQRLIGSSTSNNSSLTMQRLVLNGNSVANLNLLTIAPGLSTTSTTTAFPVGGLLSTALSTSGSFSSSLSSPSASTTITGVNVGANQSVTLPSSSCTVIAEDHEGTFGEEDLAAACKASVPEPSTAFSVLGLGAMGVFAWARRRRQAEAELA